MVNVPEFPEFPEVHHGAGDKGGGGGEVGEDFGEVFGLGQAEKLRFVRFKGAYPRRFTRPFLNSRRMVESQLNIACLYHLV